MVAINIGGLHRQQAAQHANALGQSLRAGEPVASLVEEHDNVVCRRGVRNRQVGQAVAVEIGGQDSRWEQSDGITRCARKGAIAPVGQHRHSGVQHIRHS